MQKTLFDDELDGEIIVTPKNYCCPYYEITKNIHPRYCIRCNTPFSEIKPNHEHHEP